MSRFGIALFFAVTSIASPAGADGIPPPPALTDIGVDDRTGERAPTDVELVDTRGRSVRLGDYFTAGKPVLLVLVYSQCAMLCNLVLRGLADVIRAMESRPDADYQLVAVSIDPEATPHTAARQQATVCAAAQIATEHWPFLTGGESAIRELAGGLGFRYARDPRSGQIAHPSVVFVLTPDGTIAHYLHGVRYPPDVVERALYRSRAGRLDDAPGPFETALSCFRFDPTRRRYGPLVFGILRGLAIALVIGLSVCALFLHRKERSP